MTSRERATDYAFWSLPDQSFTVTYSLEEFHQLDFQVNEAYRRIPHGGIEIGALLFGRTEPGGISIEAFRLIDCEHVTGPSFVLSERDLEMLEKQIGESRKDAELAGLEVIGWFIAHTRSPLRLTDSELAVFERFFPNSYQVAVLAKPERFQATRFSFFARKPDGSLERDGTASAIILPLPGRAGGAKTSPIASIPAPTQRPAVPKPVSAESKSPVQHDAGPIARQEPRPVPAKSESEPDQPRTPVAAGESATVRAPEQPEPPRARQGITRPRSNATPTEAPLVQGAAEEELDTGPVTSLTTIPKERKLGSIEEIQQRRSSEASAGADESRSYNVRLALILVLSAALGCVVGFWAYHELPAPVVPLAVHPESAGLVVTWPTEQTREVGYAAIRINDGAQQPLSPEEKMAGAARVNTSLTSNVKVELIVQHWMRDSRGIVRYVGAIPSSSSAIEQQLAR